MHFHRFEGRRKVRLDSISPEPPGSISKDDAKARFEELNEKLFNLQDLMWGARTHAVLLVLQGRDAAGKDGSVSHVVGALNPRGVRVTSFGVPTEEELQHDFLWRVHRVTPRLGEFGIFNRSHYEDVLVVRVKDLQPRKVWKERYAMINSFERALTSGHTIVLKYFLHISKKEQEERLLAREKDPHEAWKLNLEDWRERDQWEEFTAAYEDVIAKCAAPEAPWIVVPANARWYRNLVIAETLREALEPYQSGWRKTLREQGRLKRHDIERWREKHGG
jgi:PPK2 family polyphosphate:nucleotide phosphotransferase